MAELTRASKLGIKSAASPTTDLAYCRTRVTVQCAAARRASIHGRRRFTMLTHKREHEPLHCGLLIGPLQSPEQAPPAESRRSCALCAEAQGPPRRLSVLALQSLNQSNAP